MLHNHCGHIKHYLSPVHIRPYLSHNRVGALDNHVGIGYVEEIELCVEWSTRLFKLFDSFCSREQ